MSKQESFQAVTQARNAVAHSTGPISRHDVALKRYLQSQQHIAEVEHRSANDPVVNYSGPTRHGSAESHPLLAEIRTEPPTISRSSAGPASAATAEKASSKVVVVGIDGSSHARRAADWAADEAARRHAPLRLVYAYSLPIAGYAGYSMAPDNLGRMLRVEGATLLARVSREIVARHPDLDVSTRLFQGDPVVALRRESEHARLTVVGSRGQGRVSGALLGSVAMAITGHCTAPVAVIPAEGNGGTADGPVVVGVDGSATSDAAIGFAFDEAAIRHTPLVAVLAWNDPRATLPDLSVEQYAKLEENARRPLVDALVPWGDKYPDVVVEIQVVRARPTQTLLTFARFAQLLVVGSRGRGGFTGMLLGSTSHAVITHALCPVIVVRPESGT